MHHAIRTQNDGLQAQLSLESGVSCPPDEDRCRQEFKDESDVFTILKRHGGIPSYAQPVYGEVDFDINLQDAYTAVAHTRELFLKLPPDVRAKYGSWTGVLKALADGELNQEGVAKAPSKAAASPDPHTEGSGTPQAFKASTSPSVA